MSRSKQSWGRRIVGPALVLVLVTPTVTACSAGAIDDFLRGIGIIGSRTDPPPISSPWTRIPDPGPVIDGVDKVNTFCESPDIDCPHEG